MGTDASVNLQHLSSASNNSSKQNYYLSACLQQQQQQQQQEMAYQAWTQHQEHWTEKFQQQTLPQPPPPKRYFQQELRFVIGTHCCERVILVSVQSAASASATEIKVSRMQLRSRTSAVHKRAAKCTQADGDVFKNVL
ncbi:uncharacterized protein [Periplaneta americana]|uniref:uncharacterized protein n=1 Tax=Periplaneta americana TaxID=6978 RepID=UPI0037E83988